MSELDNLNNFFQIKGIKAKAINVILGLRTNEYFVKLESGELISKIEALSREIGLQIDSINRPQIRTDYKSGCVVIETTITDKPLMVSLAPLLRETNTEKYVLPLVLGRDMHNQPICFDLVESPHVLIGGTTGSGKSILCKTMLFSLTSKMTVQNLNLIFVDPKGTELKHFSQSKYCKGYVSTAEKSALLFDTLVSEMDHRYEVLQAKGLNNINQLPKDNQVYLVVMIDELADLLLQDKKKQIYTNLVRLLQKARACGIHIIANTQRPSKDVVSTLIKSNMPTQIALRTATNFDSRVIIGEDGAERLVGKGDMLVKVNGIITRGQAAIALT